MTHVLKKKIPKIILFLPFLKKIKGVLVIKIYMVMFFYCGVHLCYMCQNEENCTIFQLWLKGVCSDQVLIPRAQPEVVFFVMSNESPNFSDYESKISPPNSLEFRRYSTKCISNWYTYFPFLLYLHNSLIPRVAYFLLPLKRKKTQVKVETLHNAFQRSRSIN